MKFKTFLVSLAIFVCELSNANNYNTVVQGPIRVVVGKSYISTVRASQPLTSFESCEGPNPASLDIQIDQANRVNRGNWAGRKAYDAAVSQALSACKSDYNADCKVVSSYYKDIISLEFVGYRACEVVVIVHGYRLN